MDAITRRSALAAGAVVVLTSCVSSSDEAVPAAGDDPTTIAAWVERHRDDLPTTYDEIALLPFSYREAVMRTFSTVLVSALVQEHLQRSIEARPGMTSDQYAAIALARELMTPAWYEATPDERQRGSKTWAARSRAVFDTPEWIRIFGSIGPEDEDVRRKIAGSIALPEPSAYDELARLPHEAQLAELAAAAPHKKASIYRGYFAHLAARRDVTTDQREALLRSAALVSPEWYEPGESPSRVETDRLLRAAFGEDAAWIMMTIGPA
jgi:hypothetical protein